MGNYTVDGKVFKSMLLSGAGALQNNAQIVNDLNVFPVPDGDTGVNMLKTLKGGVQAFLSNESDFIGEIACDFASGAVMGARGNSGVILSQIIKGIQKGLEGLKVASPLDLAVAYQKGVEYAYSAVEKPVEGTLLTVFREATEYASNNVNGNSTIEDFYTLHLKQARKSLQETKEILPVLKEAGVVDSGGAGYVYVVEGMLKALVGEELAVSFDEEVSESNAVDFSLFTSDSEMVYGYCTEFILRLQNKKVDVDGFDVALIKDYLKSIGGDSIVIYKEKDAVKVHVHTLTPGLVINECQKYGEFLTLKIENMTVQHSGVEEKKAPRKKLAVVAVASGDGITELFKELGADEVVDGGQTSNPSAGDFITAFDKVNADNIIVLPNNSNVLLASKQAKEMYANSNVYVVPTKTIQQGYVALSVINTAMDDIDDQISDIEGAIKDVSSIEVTYAVRNATLDGLTVQKGEFMAICDGHLTAVNANAVDTAIDALKVVDEDKEIITVFYGKDLDEEERQRFEEVFEETFPDFELSVYDGGQAVYSLLISVE
ncbi:MAG: DAK2 domain-containing protein [Clostridia bacterium]|nr:DAK2 domain-containing protein [Clostridia bacterium]